MIYNMHVRYRKLTIMMNQSKLEGLPQLDIRRDLTCSAKLKYISSQGDTKIGALRCIWTIKSVNHQQILIHDNIY
ncbi:hypothetical protein H5410_022899 [Solanum commersonii]|uniref:Uncharacterized protein n=1 Tax=Solanum commersonii TaxID=4109 RepID=A0A9J5ZG11_SOLCO|nr:hypothetical protein H5410_022899 [Solanum commersonii]